MLPELVVKVPALQAVQKVLPEAVWKVPATHAVHAVAPAVNVQKVHAVSVADTAYVPVEHDWQEVLPRPEVKVPALQVVQVVLARAVEKVPEEQEAHVAEEEAPTTVLTEPTEH